ncbi:MAG TPA: SCO family protein [Gammaproteobacteria bacterium]|nr:SCO family protein [Gammaproteobacteria bacterium]
MTISKSFFIALFIGLHTFISSSVFAEPKTPPPVPDALKGLGGDFTLHSINGDVSLSDFRKKVVLLYFGYINCPDACPATLSNWARAFKKLDEVERHFVQGIMVSVDPERDTLKKLSLFTDFFHPNIVGVTGSIDELKKVTKLYKTDFQAMPHEPGKNYSVHHSVYIYVIDPFGQVRGILNFNASPDKLVKNIRKALQVYY